MTTTFESGYAGQDPYDGMLSDMHQVGKIIPMPILTLLDTTTPRPPSFEPTAGAQLRVSTETTKSDPVRAFATAETSRRFGDSRKYARFFAVSHPTSFSAPEIRQLTLTESQIQDRVAAAITAKALKIGSLITAGISLLSLVLWIFGLPGVFTPFAAWLLLAACPFFYAMGIAGQSLLQKAELTRASALKGVTS